MAQVTILGRLTRDPESRVTTTGTEVVSFAVAEDIGKDKANFWECKAFDRTARMVLQYFHKGYSIMVSGDLTYNQGQDGRRFYGVIVDRVRFTGGSKPQGNGAQQAPAQAPPQQVYQAPMAPVAPVAPQQAIPETSWVYDEDLGF